jgi:hypothetical protein
MKTLTHKLHYSTKKHKDRRSDNKTQSTKRSRDIDKKTRRQEAQAAPLGECKLPAAQKVRLFRYKLVRSAKERSKHGGMRG